MKQENFLVDNKLLIQAACGGSACRKLAKCNGYLHCEYDKPVGRAFLEYCYAEIFDVHRFPGYENYYENGSRECQWLVESGAISDEDIAESIEQLRGLYLFTQEYLKNRGVDCLTLYRSLQDHEYRTLCKMNGNKLQIRTNKLMSFAYSDRTTYGTDIKIKRKVSAEDILMIDSITEYDMPDTTCEYRIKTGEFEMWVLNRDKYGRLIFNFEDIVQDLRNLVPGMDAISQKPRTYSDPVAKETDCSIELANEFLWRPCECGYLAPWIIKRNKKLLERRLGIVDNE